MRKFLVITILLTLMTGLLMVGTSGCKKSNDVTEYSLTVTVNTGTKGSPTAGLYVFDAVSQVAYAYTLKDRYTDLKVKLDGNDIDPSGNIDITGTHILDVSATAIPGDFLLSVTVATGVTGTPETGNFYYNRDETLPYSFSLNEGYVNLKVQLDGLTVPNSGTLTFERAHTLNVFADKYYEIRGNWTLKEQYEDKSQFTVTLTFSGTETSGMVTDSDGGRGTYTTNGPSLNFTLVYPQVTYEYDGTFSAEGSMYGYSNRTTSAGISPGAWTATLNTTTVSSATLKAAGKSKH